MPDTPLMLLPVERWREVSVGTPDLPFHRSRSSPGSSSPADRPKKQPPESERAMHDVQTDEPVLRVVEPFGQGPQDLEPE